MRGRATVSVLAATTLAVSGAEASELGSDGRLVWASDAIAAYGLESFDEAKKAGGVWLSYGPSGPIVAADLTSVAFDAATVVADDGIEGARALKIAAGGHPGLAIADPTLATLASQRFSVTMWGKANGAEPVLEVVYGEPKWDFGPWHFARVVAVRTGRETSDGWIEYGTGPIDGSAFGVPAKAIVLSARYATDHDEAALVDWAFSKYDDAPPTILAKEGYALLDAIEVRPEAGAITPFVACTEADADTTCGASGTCMFGRCADSTFSWGAMPPAAHVAELAERLVFVEAHLHGDRRVATEAAAFASDVAAITASATSPKTLLGALQRRVALLRDGHTRLGAPPSGSTLFYPLASTLSHAIDVCFGIAVDDIAGKTTPDLVVYGVGSVGPVVSSFQVGDVLATIDGVDAATWLAGELPRYNDTLPNDPTADPSFTARRAAALLSRRASSVTVRRCDTTGACTESAIDIAGALQQEIASTGGWDGSSLACTTRFRSATTKTPTELPDDVVVEPGNDGITRVAFDGFTPASASAWSDAWTSAVGGHPELLVDARTGNGGKNWAGAWLARFLRGTEDPYGLFGVPRGAYDEVDDAWILDASWDACADPTKPGTPEQCFWADSLDFFSNASMPPGSADKIAWLNGDDVSMNDIFPRAMQGRQGFRIFGPHPTIGAFGSITDVPAIVRGWSSGSIQWSDSRFGATIDDARMAPWQSGSGVAPDEVVVQKLSDVLAGKDTMLEAASAWLVAP